MSEWQPYRQIGPEPPRGGIVLVADHASNHVPDDIELGIEPALLNEHIAIDIGVEGVAERMARRHGVPAHLATVSRLVCDLHREEDNPAVVPTSSDGHLIAGNIGADVEGRLDRFHRPYHAALSEWLVAVDPALIISLHSFTPALSSKVEERPWEVALLYNTDDAPARHAIRLFGEQGLTVGDNEPYSGRELNATMNRHAEAHGRHYLAIEVRQDQIATEAGQARWADMIADIAGQVSLMLESA
ncbi:N-formylglutamate amidohydrolase [Tsuneonella amylolytica]|uniref:N-formylglutamate amidohydrolase n=1 Tax=Tsuneonella amylolytica TaxID=2338327 RepID=UPI000EA84651|nr:N-formylglutamate amidohydrolase [Tsuneonella amylolytica]